MDRDEALKLLKGGPEGITEWNRRRNSELEKTDIWDTDLYGADLYDADLRDADLRDAGLRDANFYCANLSGANLCGANLRDADFADANLYGANLSHAHFIDAKANHANFSDSTLIGAALLGANLSGANLSGANLGNAHLDGANLGGATLRNANLRDASCGGTIFANIDLSEVLGLCEIDHKSPSTIGIDTIFRSGGKIPDSFLRGCGVPEYLIENQKALIGSLEPIQFYSCFISYSTTDEDFAKRLHSKMREAGLRVWFAPEDMQAGKKIHEQVDEAIRVFDKLLLVISPNSIESKWVRDEIRRARKSETRDGRKKLFPVRIMDYKPIKQWQSFYADLAEDVAEEIREYFIPDFSNWKDHDSFEPAFARLLRDLKSDESTGTKPS
jgi:hypothetical protein